MGFCFALWAEMTSPTFTFQESMVPSIEQSQVPNRVSGLEPVAGDKYTKE